MRRGPYACARWGVKMWWLVLLAVGVGAQPTLTWGGSVTNVARPVSDNGVTELRNHVCYQTYNGGQSWIVAWLDASNGVRSQYRLHRAAATGRRWLLQLRAEL